MNFWRLFIFFTAAVLYVVNKFLLGFMGLETYMIPYLNDMLCMPVVLTLALLFQQKVVYKTIAYRLNKSQIIFAVIYFTFVFEVVLPLFSGRYTADVWDILAYTSGAILFYFCINPKPVSTRKIF